jgi:pimeloyl-ACP methyl ester carboxylesterase
MSLATAEDPRRARMLVMRGDVAIDVIVEGAGPLLVMLPSSSRDSEDFDEIAVAFAAAGFRVLRPQPRGIGGSVGPLDNLTLHDLAADIAAVVAGEARGPAVVVGHAFGQWVGRTLAADRPDLVRAVVLAAAAARAVAPALRDALVRAADDALAPSERLAALRLAFFAPGHDPAIWLTGWHKAAGASQRAAANATPLAEWWAAGSAPILDLQAADDPWRPRSTAGALQQELGAERVTVKRIANASHALLPEQPQAVVDAVLDWLRSL